MRRLTLLGLFLLSLAPGAALADAAATQTAAAQATETQTWAPSNTPTPTSTPTSTATATPTLQRRVGNMAWKLPCPTPPCDGADMFKTETGGMYYPDAGGGGKTVECKTEKQDSGGSSASATIDILCKLAGSESPAVTLATLTGSTCSTKANCLYGPDHSWCDDFYVSIAACTNCAVSCWYRQE